MVLLLRCRWYNHFADARVPALPGQKRPEQCFAVDRVRLCAPSSPRHGDRRGIDDMAFNVIYLERSMYPETVEAGFLDDRDIKRPSDELLGSPAQACQQGK